VDLCLENMLPHLLAGKTRDLLWILGAFETPGPGVCLDTGHAFLSGDLTTVVEKLSGHLVMVHANDNTGQRDDHLPPGDGDIDWTGLLSKLAAQRFTGVVILEIEGSDDNEHTLRLARRGRRHLWNVAREAAQRRTNGRPTL
jgi:sugar phosphate isomerase/epimerase